MFQAHVFTSKNGECAAFLSNFNTQSYRTVLFKSRHHTLPPWSISILPDCKNVVFNTAKVFNNKPSQEIIFDSFLSRFFSELLLLQLYMQVGVQTSQMQMVPSGLQSLNWERYGEEISSLNENSKFSVVGLLDQINVTRDTSDYLWYITR